MRLRIRSTWYLQSRRQRFPGEMAETVSNRLLIEGGASETRVAVVEGDRLVELHVERAGERPVVGNVYKGRVTRVLPGLQAIFIDIGLRRDAFLIAADPAADPDEGGSAEPPVEPPRVRVAHTSQPGDELLVQVSKQPPPGKGARVTTQISLPGRFLVLLPGGGEIGISRRIADPEERQRLEALLAELRPQEGGLIARTQAAGKGAEPLQRDLQRLLEQWQVLLGESKGAPAPALLHQELELCLRSARDLSTGEDQQIWVAGHDTHQRIADYLAETDPRLVERVRLHRGVEHLFHRFGIESAVNRTLESRVWLDSGGCIVISPTEALVAIDVNSGRYTGTGTLETTALHINIEAAVEVARQIRLRDLSGIIVVDFIDMTESEHRAAVLKALETELAKDRSRTQLAGISDFGLVQITRKRMRAGLVEQLTEPCPCCAGQGRIKDAATVAGELGRALEGRCASEAGTSCVVRGHPRLLAALRGRQRPIIEELQDKLSLTIHLESDSSLHPDDFELVLT